jgi:hypothetical protein
MMKITLGESLYLHAVGLGMEEEGKTRLLWMAKDFQYPSIIDNLIVDTYSILQSSF